MATSTSTSTSSSSLSDEHRNSDETFDDATIQYFDAWVSKHGKSYHSVAEQQARRSVFESNVARWTLLNKVSGGASFGPQDEQYADQTPAEFVRSIANCGIGGPVDDYESSASTTTPMSSDGTSTTTSTSIATFQNQQQQQQQHSRRATSTTFMFVDWRNHEGTSYVTPVKNQGPHGTCWSFGAAENLEGLNVRQGYPLANISEQEFISCCSNCNGRSAEASFEWLLRRGGRPALEEGYPYNGNASIPCHANDAPRAPATLHSWGRIQDDEEGTGLPILMGLAHRGPMGMGVDASCFHGYRSGIIRNCTSHGVNHAVLMVAAGTDVYYNDNEMPTIVDFFAIKNSWGSAWGEDGYVRIEQGKEWWGRLDLIYTE